MLQSGGHFLINDPLLLQYYYPVEINITLEFCSVKLTFSKAFFFYNLLLIDQIKLIYTNTNNHYLKNSMEQHLLSTEYGLEFIQHILVSLIQSELIESFINK